MKKRILVIEDDRDISELICYNLARDGYDVSLVFDGLQAFDFAAKIRPDLIILDLMLPGMDGLDICRQLKSDDQLKSIPVIMLTAKSEEADMIVGLQMGADDYIAKPFSPRVLAARIKAMMRRYYKAEPLNAADHERVYGDLTIDLLKRKVTYQGNSLEFTAMEFNILEFLSRSPGRVYTREQILDVVWKDGKFIVDRAVDVHVRGLRKKLGKARHYIETVRGTGYRFKEIL
ncbi:MAG: response regulator transcription factor [Candidatus Omnitrophica bacterium]|nr:response regulator transcription factor [Candidatus Omnitrophota bacterium]